MSGRQHKHCKYGHQLTFDNVYTRRSGARRCKTCLHAWKKLYAQKPKWKKYNKEYKKKYIEEHRQQINKSNWQWAKTNPERRSEAIKRWLAKPETKIKRRIYDRRWRMENPRSARYGSYELQDAMNSVRRRDDNTCQWYRCGLKHKATKIHVHHIFPRAEHPELELVEQYMICYCAEHHAQFHAARGDSYSAFISSKTHKFLNANAQSLISLQT